MCSLLAFFPGKRRLTNGMLSDLRAAGFYAGQAKAMGWRRGLGRDAFAEETAAIRQMVALRFRRCPRELTERVRAREDVNVFVWVIGHHKSDPDAWLLLGKAALDGIVDAGVVRRDRDHVLLAGEVSRDKGMRARCSVSRPASEQIEDNGLAGFWLIVDGLCDCPEVLCLGGVL